MRTEEWLKVEELLSAALELDPAARRTFLDKVGASAPDVRREVESLLVFEKQADGFLAAPALAFSADFFDDVDGREERAGQTVGHYQIIREIGHGGMGTVYLGQRSDDQYRKFVAIKVVRRGMDTEEIVRRFRNERQILASLEHPYIACLLDGGTTDDGLPYLVMEYVEGLPITDYCDQHRLPTNKRLELFRMVCAAVQHAHQNLVVHRDLKPSNILITSDATPKLLDFGISKVLRPELFALTIEHTRTELRVLTPDYASPEQVRGEKVTTVADIYSLGVVLYELLTGHLPYRATTAPAHELARIICEQEPTRPSAAVSNIEVVTHDDTKPQTTITPESVSRARDTQPDRLRRNLSGDLDNIVLMALRKEPKRRYESAAQLSADIGRHLDGLPVIARKDTFKYRASKFVRRNRLGVAAAAVVLLTLVVGIITTAWQARRATKEAAVAAQERDRARQRFNDVRQLSNALLTDIAPKIERLQGSTEARQALVNQSLKYLDSLANESADDLSLQSELASAYEKVGHLQGAPREPNLSDYSGAIVSYEKAQAIRRRLLEKSPDDAEKRRLLAANHNELSNIRFWMADLPGSLKESEAAQTLYEKLVAEQPGSVELRLALAETNIDFADILYHKQQFANTYPYLRKALSSLEEVRLNSPADRNVLYLLGKGYTNLGIALSWDGKQAEGEVEMAKALAINESLVERDPNDVVFRNALWTTYLQASSLYEEVNDALSESYALKALRLITETVEKDPADIQARQNLAKSYSKLSASYINMKRLPAAVLYAEKALTAFADLERSEPKNLTYKRSLGIAYTRLGDAKYRQRDLQGSLEAFERSIASFEEIAQADPQSTVSLRDIAQACKNIGNIHRDLTQTGTGEQRQAHLQAAKQNYQRALEILLRLKSQNAFAELDEKFLEEMQAVIERMNEK